MALRADRSGDGPAINLKLRRGAAFQLADPAGFTDALLAIRDRGAP